MGKDTRQSIARRTDVGPAPPPGFELEQNLPAQQERATTAPPPGFEVEEEEPRPQTKIPGGAYLPEDLAKWLQKTVPRSPDYAAQLKEAGTPSDPSLQARDVIAPYAVVTPGEMMARMLGIIDEPGKITPVGAAKAAVSPIVEGVKRFIEGGRLRNRARSVADLLRGAADQASGGLQAGMSAIPAVAGLNAALSAAPAAVDLGGTIVESITKKLAPVVSPDLDQAIAGHVGRQTGERFTSTGTELAGASVFGLPVLIGMVASKGASAVSGEITKDADLSAEDKTRIKELVGNIAFFAGMAGGAGGQRIARQFRGPIRGAAGVDVPVGVSAGPVPEDISRAWEIRGLFPYDLPQSTLFKPSGETGTAPRSHFTERSEEAPVPEVGQEPQATPPGTPVPGAPARTGKPARTRPQPLAAQPGEPPRTRPRLQPQQPPEPPGEPPIAAADFGAVQAEAQQRGTTLDNNQARAHLEQLERMTQNAMKSGRFEDVLEVQRLRSTLEGYFRKLDPKRTEPWTPEEMDRKINAIQKKSLSTEKGPLGEDPNPTYEPGKLDPETLQKFQRLMQSAGTYLKVRGPSGKALTMTSIAGAMKDLKAPGTEWKRWRAQALLKALDDAVTSGTVEIRPSQGMEHKQVSTEDVLRSMEPAAAAEPTLEPRQPIEPGADVSSQMRDEGLRLGIEFAGMQQMGKGKASQPMFRDPRSGSNFVVHADETTEQALARIRQPFIEAGQLGAGEAPGPELSQEQLHGIFASPEMMTREEFKEWYNQQRRQTKTGLRAGVASDKLIDEQRKTLAQAALKEGRPVAPDLTPPALTSSDWTERSLGRIKEKKRAARKETPLYSVGVALGYGTGYAGIEQSNLDEETKKRLKLALSGLAFAGLAFAMSKRVQDISKDIRNSAVGKVMRGEARPEDLDKEIRKGMNAFLASEESKDFSQTERRQLITGHNNEEFKEVSKEVGQEIKTASTEAAETERKFKTFDETRAARQKRLLELQQKSDQLRITPEENKDYRQLQKYAKLDQERDALRARGTLPRGTAALEEPEKPFRPGFDQFVADDLKPALEKAKEAASAAIGVFKTIPGLIGGIFQPAFSFERKYGIEPSAKVQEAIHEGEGERINFSNQYSTLFDKTYRELETWFNKYPEEVQNLFNFSRGTPATAEGHRIQDEAVRKLPERLKDQRLMKAIKEVSDWVWGYARENNVDLNYFQDYFYGAYKQPERVKAFLDYWRSTERYAKEKTLPTVADASAYGLELKDANPITNIKKELEAVAKRVGLRHLQDYNLDTNAPYMVNANLASADQVVSWRIINDPVFNGMMFDPLYARYVNSLLKSNVMQATGLTRGLRNTAYGLQMIKYIGSIFHLSNMVKHSISANVGGIANVKGIADFIKGFKPADFTSPEYIEYAKLGGGHTYSIESASETAMMNAIDRFKDRNVLGGLLRIPAAVLGEKWIPASPGNVKWMFETYIPTLKFNRFLKDKAEFAQKQGRDMTRGEQLERIRTIQQFYGEMNERLYGRSGSVTSLLRLVFLAPGYGEGNFRTTLAAANLNKLRKGDPETIRNLHYVVNSLVTTATLASIGTMVLTGKPPKIPTQLRDVRDLFKIQTGTKDGNGDNVYVDLMTFDKDFWSIYGSIATGQPGNILPQFMVRVKGATSPAFKTMTDLAMLMHGRMLYDYKGKPVYYATDPWSTKFGNVMLRELGELQPISQGTFTQAADKGDSFVGSLGTAMLGIRSTNSENVKRIKGAKGDLYSMRDQKARFSADLTKIRNENPELARELVEKFNEQQLRKIDEICKDIEIPPESVDPKTVRSLYLINPEPKTRQRPAEEKSGSSLSRELNPKNRVDASTGQERNPNWQ